MSNGQTIGQASYARAINRTLPSTIISNGAKGPPVKKYKVSLKKKKVKKMGWFKRKFVQWSREAWENGRDEMVDTTVVARDSINGKTSVRFTVYPASGGFVIEHYKQDRYKEHDGPDLTIVNHGEDLGKAVEHIIALEALKS